MIIAMAIVTYNSENVEVWSWHVNLQWNWSIDSQEVVGIQI